MRNPAYNKHWDLVTTHRALAISAHLDRREAEDSNEPLIKMDALSDEAKSALAWVGHLGGPAASPSASCSARRRQAARARTPPC